MFHKMLRHIVKVSVLGYFPLQIKMYINVIIIIIEREDYHKTSPRIHC